VPARKKRLSEPLLLFSFELRRVLLTGFGLFLDGGDAEEIQEGFRSLCPSVMVDYLVGDDGKFDVVGRCAESDDVELEILGETFVNPENVPPRIGRNGFTLNLMVDESFEVGVLVQLVGSRKLEVAAFRSEEGRHCDHLGDSIGRHVVGLMTEGHRDVEHDANGEGDGVDDGENAPHHGQGSEEAERDAEWVGFQVFWFSHNFVFWVRGVGFGSDFNSSGGIPSEMQKMVLDNRPWVEEPGRLPTDGSDCLQDERRLLRRCESSGEQSSRR